MESMSPQYVLAISPHSCLLMLSEGMALLTVLQTQPCTASGMAVEAVASRVLAAVACKERERPL